MPSVPTVLDELANAAFFFGMMSYLSHNYDDIRPYLKFSDVKSNFLSAARDGLRAQQVWFDERQLTAQQLILDELLPQARRGLDITGLVARDIDRYIGVY